MLGYATVHEISSVLIIDDEKDVRDLVSEIFKDQGVSHICAAASAEEALKILEEEPFSLIICDYKLTGMNGVAFMGKLRLKRDMTPILFITGDPHHEEVTRAVAQMKAGFLEKPFGISTLMSSVKKLLG